MCGKEDEAFSVSLLFANATVGKNICCDQLRKEHFFVALIGSKGKVIPQMGRNKLLEQSKPCHHVSFSVATVVLLTKIENIKGLLDSVRDEAGIPTESTLVVFGTSPKIPSKPDQQVGMAEPWDHSHLGCREQSGTRPRCDEATLQELE